METVECQILHLMQQLELEQVGDGPLQHGMTDLHCLASKGLFVCHYCINTCMTSCIDKHIIVVLNLQINTRSKNVM